MAELEELEDKAVSQDASRVPRAAAVRTALSAREVVEEAKELRVSAVKAAVANPVEVDSPAAEGEAVAVVAASLAVAAVAAAAADVDREVKP